MYQYHFSYTHEDLWVFNRVYRKVYRHWGTVLRVIACLFGVLNVFAGLLTLWAQILAEEHFFLWNLLIGAFLLWVALRYDHINARSSRRMLLKDTGEFTITLEETGLREQSRKGEGFYPWASFIGLCYSRERYLLFLDKRHAIIIPQRAMGESSIVSAREFMQQKTQKEIKEIR